MNLCFDDVEREAVSACQAATHLSDPVFVQGQSRGGVRRDSRAPPSDNPRQPTREQHPARTRRSLLCTLTENLTLHLLPQVPLQMPSLETKRPASNDVFVGEEVRTVAEVAEEGGGPAAVEGGEGEGAQEGEEGGWPCGSGGGGGG